MSIQDLHEKIRHYHEHMIARSGRAMSYWEKIPPIRMGEALVDRVQKLIETITEGKGNIREASMDLGFVCFLFAEMGPQIAEVSENLDKSTAKEKTEEEHDPDREEWERKRAERKGAKKGNESWRG